MTDAHAISRLDVMAYLDNELPADQAATVLAHVNDCEECRAYLNELRHVSLTLAQGDAEALTTSSSVVMAASPGRSFAAWIRKSRLALMPRWVWIAVPIVAVMMLVVAVDQRSRAVSALSQDRATAPAAAVAEPRDKLRSLGYVSAGKPEAKMAPPTDQLAKQPVRLAGSDAFRTADVQTGGADPSAQPMQSPVDAPMIARSVDLAFTTDKFGDVRPSLDRLLAIVQGTIGSLTIGADEPNHRSLEATLRVPAAKLDATLAGIRQLGHVQRESQSSEDVSDAHRDLVIRLSNGRKEEQRLTTLLTDRTGKLSDVLAVEQQVTRVRTEIEQLDAEERAMRGRVALSTITLHVSETYRADLTLGPLPLGTRLRNAMVDGTRGAVTSVVDATMALLQVGPTLLVWALLFGVPVMLIWHRRRARSRTAR